MQNWNLNEEPSEGAFQSYRCDVHSGWQLGPRAASSINICRSPSITIYPSPVSRNQSQHIEIRKYLNCRVKNVVYGTVLKYLLVRRIFHRCRTLRTFKRTSSISLFYYLLPHEPRLRTPPLNELPRPSMVYGSEYCIRLSLSCCRTQHRIESCSPLTYVRT